MSKFIKLTLRESGRTIAIDAARVSKIREFKEGGCVVVGHEVNCEVSQSIEQILAQIGGETMPVNNLEAASNVANDMARVLGVLKRLFDRITPEAMFQDITTLESDASKLCDMLKASNP